MTRLTSIVPFCLLVCCILRSHANKPDDPPTADPRIREIILKGNRTTRDEIIHVYLGLDTGLVCDSVLIHRARRRLYRTGLFSSVHLYPIRRDRGVTLYVIVQERFYYQIPQIGGDIRRKKYNRDARWLWVYCNVTRDNFRGWMETLSLTVTAWEEKQLSILWRKPLLPSPYFIATGFRVGEAPDQDTTWHRYRLSGSFTFGRRVLDHSMLYGFLMPSRTTIKNVDPLTFEPVGNDSIFSEIMIGAGWLYDTRNSIIDPSRGRYYHAALKTNALQHDEPKYVELDTEFKCFFRGFVPVHTIALWNRSVFRTRDMGGIKRIITGGEGTVRGVPYHGIGETITANNLVRGSLEYRFPLYSFPCISLPWIAGSYPVFSKIESYMQGVIFADAGFVWRHFESPLGSNDHGMGAGAGIRLLFPSFNQAGSMEIGFGGEPGEIHEPWNLKPALYLRWGVHF